MNSYTPRDPAGLCLMLLAVGSLTAGMGSCFLARPVRGVFVWGAWLIGVVCVTGAEFRLRTEPPGVRMVALIIALLWCMKLVVFLNYRQQGGAALTPLAWLSFHFGWPGMQPAIFARPLRPDRSQAVCLAARGLLRLCSGAAMILLARYLAPEHVALPFGTVQAVLATLLLLVGLSLTMHFGVFNLLAAVWQAIGWNCQPVFRAPLASASLAEFWSRRWNLAFSEMTAVAVYRPLLRIGGQSTAVFAGFAFSGLLHEVAISLPVRAAYGQPLLYFLIHGGLVLLERRLDLAKRWGAIWRLGVVIALVTPLPLLFPPQFLLEIVWPLAGAEP